MVDKSEATGLSNQENHKFGESMTEIMKIINESGGVKKLIRKAKNRRHFKSGDTTFSEMKDKKNTTKTTIKEPI